ncbi:MAG: FAD-binding oxidoreductase [Ignavibacteria bacterium]|nr:FAD-binding oxidoreductase [Ignavibacteria bacterium]
MGDVNSIWDAKFLEYDVAVIGGGIIGVNTAISLAEKNSSLRIVILERGIVPQGASTRNAGFACFGSASEIAADIDLLGPEATFDLVYKRVSGVHRLLDRLKNHNVGLENHGGYDVLLQGFAEIDSSMHVMPHTTLQRLDEINSLLLPIFSVPVFHAVPERLAQHRFGAYATHLIYTPFESTIHSGKLMYELWRVAERKGIQIRTGFDVQDIQSETVAGITQHTLHANSLGANQHTNTQPPIKCKHVVVAASAQIPMLTNAYADLEIVPARGQIIVTSPIPNLAINGSYHMDGGYYYFRNVGNRVLLGGGRNTAFEAEQTVALETSMPIMEHLERICKSVLLPHTNYTIDHRWAGTMAFSSSKQPIVKTIAPGVTVAFGCNGMGVAMAAHVGNLAANCLP